MLKKQKRKSSLKNEEGMAVLELIPIIIVIVLLVNFSLGFFGAIHTGILNSIASRNYAFETFRNRSNLNYLSAISSDPNTLKYTYNKIGMRVHGTLSENAKGQDWIASARLIDFFTFQKRAAEVTGNTKAEHEKVRNLPGGRNEGVAVNPIWVKTTYGICLNAGCTGT
nr:hypothetical protein CKG001_01180 [Bdellovibrio sp. CKG001]BFD61438.1 hypothetical protein BdHM001_01190 [Bdellovibrio sp. HM001]BFD65170.1 hypothetical protein HAGR004_01920 [Bdellovibrio sp. HAGR004]